MIKSGASAAQRVPARGDCFNRACPTREALAHVTGRWGSLVMSALRSGEEMRFSQLRDRIEGISEKMLTQTLRELERDGIVRRTSYPVVPPHVEYALTPFGAGIARHVADMVDYIETHVRDLVRAQREHDADA